MGEVFSQVVSEDLEDHVRTLMTQEILCELSYEQFLVLLGELNILAKKCLDSRGHRLVFAVKKDSDSTVFWKATVQIACAKIDLQSEKVLSYRMLSLSQFLKVFNNFKCQLMAAEHSEKKSTGSLKMTISTLLDGAIILNQPASSEGSNECTICFERNQDVTLPCAHSYCTQCIEEWNEAHDTCPICRERLESPNDTWVLSEVPKAEEISKEITQNLLQLSEDRQSTCNPS